MVLVSHTNRFIYTKTVKTGGTSVEIYFERFCVPPGEYEEQHMRPAAVTPAGIIGFRGGKPDSPWYNHMPAAAVRELLGADVFSRYFKFCVVRNPYDKMVSWFFWHLPPEERELCGRESFGAVRDRFRNFILVPTNLVRDRDKYVIDGEFCVDGVMRYEAMLADLEETCAKVGVPFEAERLGRYKNQTRARPEPFSEYYDDETAGIIERNYDFELKRFGYSLRG